MAFKAPTVGELNTHFTIQEESRVENARGGKDVVWTTKTTDWARVEATSGMAKQYANDFENSITHKIAIRHNPKVKRGMRMHYDGFYVTINTVINHSHARKKYMELLVTQQDNEI